MKKLNLVINQHPIPQKRHRHSKWGTYDPNSKDKNIVKNIIKTQSKGFYTEQPVSVMMDFKILRPKSHYRTGKYSNMLKSDAPMFHTKKPDIDNLLKFIMDCCSGIVYKDDCQVDRCSASKVYCEKGEEPRTEINIMIQEGK